MVRYTDVEYRNMLLIYGECGRNAREAARVYRQRYNRLHYPSSMVFIRLFHRSGEHGTFAANRNINRPRPVCNEEMTINVLAAITVNPHYSTR